MGKGPHDSNENDSYAKLSWGSGLRKKERYPRRSIDDAVCIFAPHRQLPGRRRIWLCQPGWIQENYVHWRKRVRGGGQGEVNRIWIVSQKFQHIRWAFDKSMQRWDVFKCGILSWEKAVKLKRVWCLSQWEGRREGEKGTGRVHPIYHPPLSAIPTQQQLIYIKLILTGSWFPALPPRIQFPMYWNSNYRS